MDYTDKFVKITVRHQIKQGYKIYEIDWYTYFKTKSVTQKICKQIKNKFSNFTFLIRKSVSKCVSKGSECCFTCSKCDSMQNYLLKINFKTISFPKNFQTINKNIKAMVINRYIF